MIGQEASQDLVDVRKAALEELVRMPGHLRPPPFKGHSLIWISWQVTFLSNGSPRAIAPEATVPNRGGFGPDSTLRRLQASLSSQGCCRFRHE